MGFGANPFLIIAPKPGNLTVPHIIVDDEQARIISKATEKVEIRDGNGNRLGFVAHGFTDEDIAIAKQRRTSTEPRYTTHEVLEHLRSLDEK